MDIREPTGTAEDEFTIELGPARVAGPVPGVMPAEDLEFVCQSVGRRDRRQARVFISLEAWRAARDHTAQDGSRELGGILWGLPHENAREQFLQIVEARPATMAQGDLGQLTFGHDAWQEVLQEQSDDRRVVGWYHSHPGFGIFLSEQDKFIHRHFFDQPWQVALVLDPVQGVWGLYGWSEEGITPWRGFELFSSTGHRNELAAQVRLAKRG